MKYLNQKKFKTLFIILSFTFVLLSSLNIATPSRMSSENELNSTNEDIINYKYSDHTFIYNLNGKRYLAEYITREKVEEMKMHLSSEETKRNYNEIIDGHGTGYSTSTEEDLETLIGKISLLELSSGSNQKYKASADISTEIYFPSVGDQGMQGSCSAWANAYYAYGYLEAKDYGWDASSGNPDYLLSPAWAYNIVAAYDYGSIPYEVAQVLLDWGVPTLSAIPYDDSDVDSWGNETAWREAPYHRPLNYTLITYTGPATIDLMKSLITAGTPVTIGIDAYQFYNGLDEGTMDFILSSDEYNPSGGLNHAQCLVGYDDAITEGSDIGAFRVVNSWGASWMDGGYYWLTYDAFSEFADDPGQVIMFITDRIDYYPDLIATWEFNPAPTRMGDIITLGVGPYASPLDYKTPHYDYDTNNVFPDFMALDISDFLPYYNVNNDEFFFLDIGFSIITGTLSSFLIERYTTGVLVETTYESTDVPQSTPGYVTNTFMDFNHEISVSLEVPEDPEIYETYLINATVQNIGIYEEWDIELNLYLDGGMVNSAIYPSLSPGASETIDYLWTPMVYDTFNFTVFAPPIAGEYSEANNFKYSLVTVEFLRNYTMTVGHPYTWIDASGGTELILYDDDYATISLPFDFTFYDQTFSTIYLCSNGYLSFYDTMPWQYSNVPFPSDDLSHYYMIAPFWDDIYPSTGGHIYVQSFGTYWVAEWQDIYHFNDELIGSFQVVLNETGEIMFNYDYLNYTYGGYTCGLNLGVNTEYYNNYQGLTDSTDDLSILFYLEPLEHDLRVTLDKPRTPELGTSYLINATVKNVGANDESDINLYLYYDEILVNSTFIPLLPVGTNEMITYNWTPTTYRTYNLTTYAPPVINEIYISNNRVESLITIHPIKLFDGMFLNYSFEIFGDFYSWNSLYSDLSERIFHNDYSIYLGGSLADAGYWDVDSQTRIMSDSAGGFAFGPGTHTPLWIFTGLSIGDMIPINVDAEGDHMFNITGDFLYDLPGFGTVDVWILEDLSLPGGIAWYEKSTGILLYGLFPYHGGMYYYIFNFVDTNAPFEYIIFDHDLKVYLETPLSHQIDETYIINATVKNNGLNDENNVELFLYLDGVSVASTTIPTLTVGSEQTIQYIWTPTEYGTYNFTAYAPAVPLESYLDNNRKTTFVYLFETQLFDGLYIKLNYSEAGSTFTTNFTYTPYTGRLYYETWNINYMGILLTYTWMVDLLTRVMSASSVFGFGAHTPAWIFTNTSLYDTIPIAADGEGDHDFYVARELVYDLPGFGLVEVWELEDLTSPGGIAWYEKSTGILLNGTFFYAGGMANYTFDFVDTNAEFIFWKLDSLTITTPDSSSSWEPGSSHYIYWTSTGTISDVKIELYKEGVFELEIEASTTNDGEFSWTIPSDLDDSTQYQIKISDASNPSIYDFSDYFEIKIPVSGKEKIPGYNLYLLIGIISVVSVLLIKFRIKKSK